MGKVTIGRCFLDTNVFLYAIGAPSPHREACRAVLAEVEARRMAATTSTEVLQEVLFVLTRKGRRPEALVATRSIMAALDEVLPVTTADLERAIQLLDVDVDCGVRDAIHAATALNNGIIDIVSVDDDFDRIAGVRRHEPAAIAAGVG